MTGPVIVEAAINGVTTTQQNPNVPITAEEIAADALAWMDAGATIIHAHCNPGGGSPEEVAERQLAAFRRVWAERPGALLSPTLDHDGSDRFTHLRILARHGVRIGVLDPGSVNLLGGGADGMPAGDHVYANSFDTIRDAWTLHAEAGPGPSQRSTSPALSVPPSASGAVACFPAVP